MVSCAHLLGAAAALSLATGAAARDVSAARWRAGEAVPHLEVRLKLDPDASKLPLPDQTRPSAGRTEPPPCVADVCQPRVDVPGFETKLGRPHRSELFAALLDRAGIEPFATIAWVFVSTGFRLDYSPPALDAGDPATIHRGWGSVFVRLRLRMDPMNHPVFPDRARARDGQRSWTGLIAPRA